MTNKSDCCQKDERFKARKAAYERRAAELGEKCKRCITQSRSPININRCEHTCTIGRQVRWLESEYSDIIGWSHKKWTR